MNLQIFGLFGLCAVTITGVSASILCTTSIYSFWVNLAAISMLFFQCSEGITFWKCNDSAR